MSIELSNNKEPSTSRNISLASQTWTNVTDNYQKSLQFNNNSGLKIDISVIYCVGYFTFILEFSINEIIDLTVEKTNKNVHQYLS